MPNRFSELAFTPAVNQQQERHNSRRQYARIEQFGQANNRHRDGFYMASMSETGWPHLQFRGGPKGFLHLLDNCTIAFADLRGNKQYVSLGNLLGNDRVALFLMDYAARQSLKILGHAKVMEGSDETKALLEKLRTTERNSMPERVIVISLGAFDWNCPQRITPRYTATEWKLLSDNR